MEFLFSWTTFDGQVHSSNIYPGPLDTIMELILKKHGVRPNESCPEHEAAMLLLPPRLEILRIDHCRIRTWPKLPTSIREVYAKRNDFFHIDNDMSEYTNLIVLQLDDGRLEDFITRLPPTLAHCDVSSNALSLIQILNDWPETLPVINAYLNPSRMRIEPQNYKERITIDKRLNTRIELPFTGGDRTRNDINTPKESPTIYENTQNVHSSGIQDSTRKNLKYLAEKSKNRSREEILAKLSSESYIENQFSKIWVFLGIFSKKQKPFTINVSLSVIREIGIRLSQPYSMHGYHLQTILDGLISRIEEFETDEIQKTAMKRFEQEVLDGKNYCTNGFMVRMCNVLVGLDDNISVRLNPSEILQARIPNMMKAKRIAGGWTEGSEPWQWSRDCFIETIKDLDECEVFESAERKKWLEPFLLGFVDELIEECTSDTQMEERKFYAQIEKRWREWGLPVNEGWALSYVMNQK